MCSALLMRSSMRPRDLPTHTRSRRRTSLSASQRRTDKRYFADNGSIVGREVMSCSTLCLCTRMCRYDHFVKDRGSTLIQSYRGSPSRKVSPCTPQRFLWGTLPRYRPGYRCRDSLQSDAIEDTEEAARRLVDNGKTHACQDVLDGHTTSCHHNVHPRILSALSA